MTSLTDPLAKYRINQPKPDEQPSQPQQTDQQDPLDKYRIKEAQGFPGIKEIGRHAVRLGSRIAETIGGIPGDFQSLVDSGIFAGIGKT